ncbi:MAG TPA: penicillin-binding protein 1A [Coxiellaceae bacterium]|nr:penicillin-binding protein 1A [Coxiellaceae bacterium]
MKKVFRRFANHGIWAILSLALFGLVCLTAAYAYMSWQLPDVETLKDVHLQVPMHVYTSDAKLIADFGTKRRIPVSLEQVPPQLINAVLAIEDSRYYKHAGVDFIGLVRATVAVATTGRKVQGASTITMQVARNFFLTRKKTFVRKFNEILLALKIDQSFDKDKILELYLNTIYLGQRAYGVAAAAQVYYGKNLDQLSLAEMAMIAGLPQSPSTANPISNPKAAKVRRDNVLERMHDLNYITEEEYKAAINEPITAHYHQERVEVEAPYLAEMVRETLFNQYGEAAYEMGLNVYTTVTSSLQIAANNALQQGLQAYDRRHGYRSPTKNLGSSEDDRAEWLKKLKAFPTIHGMVPAVVSGVGSRSLAVVFADNTEVTINWDGLSWTGRGSAGQIAKVGDVIYAQEKDDKWQLRQIPRVEGALISINPQTGAILALVGGYSYAQSHFNRVTQAERQPGSNFKPFVYSAALAKENYTLATLINDAPIAIEQADGSWWRPHNNEEKFFGPTRLRIGLIKSRNLVSVRLLQAVEIPYVLNYLKNFGFNVGKLPTTLSLALGSGEVTPLELARGFTVFANGGYRITPYFIDKIVNDQGEITYEADPDRACRACISDPDLPASERPATMAPQAISPQNAYLMNEVLRDVIQHGTGSGAKVLNRSDIGGKTGTTNDKMDAWFSGFNANIETTVWVGYDSNKSIREYGAQAALPIWLQFMQEALKGKPESSMPEPPDIVRVRIDPKTGMLAYPGDPDAVFEVFIKDTEPTENAAYYNDDTETGGGINTGEASVEGLF